MKSSSGFRAKVLANSAAQRSRASNTEYLILPAGLPIFRVEASDRIKFDIIPYIVTDTHHPDRDDEREVAIPGSSWYRRPYKLHRGIGVENKAIICPTTAGKKCRICEHQNQLLSEGAKWDDPTVKKLRPVDRNLYLVIPYGHRKMKEELHLWDVSQFLFQDKLNAEIEENDENGDFPLLDAGLTLSVRFSEEKQGGYTFTSTSRIDFEKRDYAYPDDTAEQSPSLDNFLNILDDSAIQRLLDEGVDGPSEEEEAPRTRKTIQIRRNPVAASGNGVGKGETPQEEEKEGPQGNPPPQERRVVRQVSRSGSEEKATKPVRTAPAQEAATPVEAQTSARPLRRAPPPAETKSAERCPHSHTFGADTDRFPECEECAIWSDCADARDAASA